MTLGPAPVLALLFGLLHVSIYVLIRGSAGQRLPWLLLAAFLGAWAGDALGGRLGMELFLVGDFHVVSASILAWVGIGTVAVIALLAPQPAPGQVAVPAHAVVTSRVPKSAASPVMPTRYGARHPSTGSGAPSPAVVDEPNPVDPVDPDDGRDA